VITRDWEKNKGQWEKGSWILSVHAACYLYGQLTHVNFKKLRKGLLLKRKLDHSTHPAPHHPAANNFSLRVMLNSLGNSDWLQNDSFDLSPILSSSLSLAT
jgi:hypothetical protein